MSGYGSVNSVMALEGVSPVSVEWPTWSIPPNRFTRERVIY
jgi:hypothetical protein